MDSQRHLRNLLVMALADGSLGEREVHFVTDRCVELGLDERDLRDAVRFALDEQAELDLPTDPTAQEALLTDLFRMMAADGVLSENEKRFLAIVAAKFGYDSDRLEALFSRLLQS